MWIGNSNLPIAVNEFVCLHVLYVLAVHGVSCLSHNECWDRLQLPVTLHRVSGYRGWMVWEAFQSIHSKLLNPHTVTRLSVTHWAPLYYLKLTTFQNLKREIQINNEKTKTTKIWFASLLVCIPKWNMYCMIWKGSNYFVSNERGNLFDEQFLSTWCGFLRQTVAHIFFPPAASSCSSWGIPLHPRPAAEVYFLHCVQRLLPFSRFIL